MESRASSDPIYYLSAYLAPPGLESILHSQRHDHAVALWRRQGRTVELITYWELERFTGLKHHDLPLGSAESIRSLIETLLAEEGLAPSDIAEVWGTPGIATNEHIEHQFGETGVPIHSLAHLYSAMLVDTDIFHNGNIVALAIDGGPDTALDRTNQDCFYVGAYSVRGEVVLRAIESPGPLFIAAQHRFGLAPGTLMALAEASSVETGLDASTVNPDQRYFGGYGVYADARRVIAEIIPAAEDAATVRLNTDPEGGLTRNELVASAAMKIVQELAEAVIRRNIEMLLAESGFDPEKTHLALAGGVALNCPANSRMMRRYGFTSLLAPPCVNDSGQALGLGLLGMVSMSSSPFDFRLGCAFHGSRKLDLEAGLAELGISLVSTSELDLDTFVDDITRSPVAWVDGRAEIGPRALGHRSILADPRSPETKSLLNVMKGRQWWRPVAPIVLADQLDDWFEDPSPSPFMLQTFQVREDRREEVPAITHLDGSARVQSLDAADDDRLFRVLSHFHRVTGVPMLCNTSLNDRLEPIVATAAEAFNFCLRKGVSVIYVEGVRVELDTTNGVQPDAPRTRNTRFLQAGTDHRSSAWKAWLNDGVTQDMVWLLSRYPELRPLVGTDAATQRLRTTFDSLVQQPALAMNYAEFVAEFGPDAGGSNRHAF